MPAAPGPPIDLSFFFWLIFLNYAPLPLTLAVLFFLVLSPTTVHDVVYKLVVSFFRFEAANTS
jgi:hypothetical protein